MFVRLLFCAVVVFATCFGDLVSTHARVWQDGVSRGATDGTNVVRYRYYLPENYDPTIEYPMMLWLHGAGSRGNDNVDQVNDSGVAGLIDKTFSEYPMILVAPQAPFETGWSTTSTRELVESIVLRTMDDFSVDEKRIHVSGYSMGGFGTQAFVEYYSLIEPELFQFASASPLAAGISFIHDFSQTAPWKDTPVWLFHGVNDSVIPNTYSRNAYASFVGLSSIQEIDFDAPQVFPALGNTLTAIDDNVRLTMLPGRGHNVGPFVYSNNEYYDWMFAQSLVPEPTSLGLFTVGLVSCACGRAPRRRRGSQLRLRIAPRADD